MNGTWRGQKCEPRSIRSWRGGKAAVAKANLQVRSEMQYEVTLTLCADCLALERSYKDTNQPVSIKMVDQKEERGG
jgi:hypothetical protein